MQKPNPGSPEARAIGCTCPVLDNGHGRGRGGDGEQYGWYVNEDCPVHGAVPASGTQKLISDLARAKAAFQQRTVKEYLTHRPAGKEVG